jgi:ATP-dependent helicase/nuclease subunit A
MIDATYKGAAPRGSGDAGAAATIYKDTSRARVRRAPTSQPPDRAQREQILRELDRNLLVEAAAGTGKTTCLVGRLLANLRTGRCTPRTLAAVTFTRKAAAELRSRFQGELEAVLREGELSMAERDRLSEALAQIDLCFIGTIHAFCGRLLRERPVEAGVDLGFEELEEDGDQRLRHEAWRLHAAALVASDPDGLLPALEALDLHLSDLEPAFVAFAEYPDVEAWPVPGPEHALPDPAPAVRELRRYLAHMSKLEPRLPAEAPDRDNLVRAYRRLPRVASHFDDLADPRQLMQLLEEFRSGAYVNIGAWLETKGFQKDEIWAERTSWETFRAQHVLPQLRAWYEHRYAVVMRALEGARRTYDRLRAERGLLNFGDLLLRAAALLREHPEVRRYFARRFTHLLVDEFQDTDPIQAEVMLLLTACDPEERDWQRCLPRPGSLFVVGDPKQSIYRFRRADIVTYGIVKRILEREGPAVRLSASFRGTRRLVDWVNATFAPGFPEATDASPEYVPLLHGARAAAPGAEPDLAGALALPVEQERSYRKEDAAPDDADRVARTIRDLLDHGATVLDPRTNEVRPLGPGDFMVIAARRANLSLLARKLRDYGVPHQVTGGTGLNEVSELELLQVCLGAALQPENPVALVAALRSEAFGVSDAALYAFKTAGGRFAYRAPVPEGLDADAAAAIGEAFARLREHARWLDTLPALAAIERIVADLGLMVLAASREGGELEAGGLGKALEMLRAAERATTSASELLDLLAALVSKEEKLDGISALPERPDVVQVLNLHRAKGLEATVVFLADPTGASRHPVRVHIDRSGGHVHGYMAVFRSYGRSSLLVAQPEGWEQHAAVEQRFLEAEELRLRYVAATRARSAVAVSQRPVYNSYNPWLFFEGKLEGELPDPGDQAAPAVPGLALDEATVSAATAGIVERVAAARRPTYQVFAAKPLALAGGASSEEPLVVASAGEGSDGEEHGPEWGAVIHLLLQTALEQPAAALEPLAEAALAEHELDPELAPAAVEVVRAVLASPLWARARAARRRLAEVPFQVPHKAPGPDGSELPGVLRGVIDLLFEEPDGWVLVDYKTDQVSGPALLAAAARYAAQVRLYAAAWEQCTGKPVKEAGLFFTRTATYVTLAGV